MKVLRLREVLDRVSLSKSTVYRMIGDDQFPKPIKLGGRAVGWIEDEINQWISSRSRVE